MPMPGLACLDGPFKDRVLLTPANRNLTYYLAAPFECGPFSHVYVREGDGFRYKGDVRREKGGIYTPVAEGVVDEAKRQAGVRRAVVSIEVETDGRPVGENDVTAVMSCLKNCIARNFVSGHANTRLHLIEQPATAPQP